MRRALLAVVYWTAVGVGIVEGLWMGLKLDTMALILVSLLIVALLAWMAVGGVG